MDSAQTNHGERTVSASVHSLARLSGIGVLLLFLILIWLSARAGFASLLDKYAATTSQLAAADAAVSLSFGDPEAHYFRAAIFESRGDITAAIAEYKEAIVRRPSDYALWLCLARVEERNGETLVAIAAARQATQLAPYYARPHWELGNLLVRAARREEGFSELRLASISNPKLLPSIIDLAWQLSRGDVQFVMQAVQPSSAAAYASVADYFKKRDRIADAVVILRSAGNIAEDYRRQYVDELLKAKRFLDAYALWSIDHASPNKTYSPAAVINDPGFEEERRLNEPGFDWHTENNAQTLMLSLDQANPKEGKTSVKIEFSGDSDPGAYIISQLVMVEPNSRYRLDFNGRTESIVSGGLPLVVIADASSNEILGRSTAFPQAASNWQDYSLDFNSKETTSAILISLKRERCGDSRCPIFGRLWLDNFSLKKLQAGPVAKRQMTSSPQATVMRLLQSLLDFPSGLEYNSQIVFAGRCFM